jgi:hypothetical protein
MKRKFVCTTIAVLAILFSHTAFATSPVLLGEWVGSGKAIYPNGVVLAFNVTGTLLTQEDSLLAGFFEFALMDAPAEIFTVYFTGHIAQDKSIKLQMAAGNSSFGTGVGEAKWKGNKIEGVVRDASDLSTGYFILERAR